MKQFFYLYLFLMMAVSALAAQPASNTTQSICGEILDFSPSTTYNSQEGVWVYMDDVFGDHWLQIFIPLKLRESIKGSLQKGNTYCTTGHASRPDAQNSVSVVMSKPAEVFPASDLKAQTSATASPKPQKGRPSPNPQ